MRILGLGMQSHQDTSMQQATPRSHIVQHRSICKARYWLRTIVPNDRHVEGDAEIQNQRPGHDFAGSSPQPSRSRTLSSRSRLCCERQAHRPSP